MSGERNECEKCGDCPGRCMGFFSECPKRKQVHTYDVKSSYPASARAQSMGVLDALQRIDEATEIIRQRAAQFTKRDQRRLELELTRLELVGAGIRQLVREHL